MMQAVLPDQGNIRRRLRFVNQIGRGEGRRQAAKYIQACIEETYCIVSPEHTSMYWRNILVCIWDTIRYVFKNGGRSYADRDRISLIISYLLGLQTSHCPNSIRFYIKAFSRWSNVTKEIYINLRTNTISQYQSQMRSFFLF